MYVCMYVCMCVCVYVCMNECMCVFVCIYVSMCYTCTRIMYVFMYAVNNSGPTARIYMKSENFSENCRERLYVIKI